MTAPSLAQRIRAREPLLGPLLRMPNEALVELTGLAGMDFVVIDTEHGPGDQIPLTQHFAAAAAAGLPALVRIGQVSEILRVLDLGAAGIIAPHVSSVEQAEEIVRAAHYPPRGDRGFATYSRSGRYGLVTPGEHLRNARDGTAVIVMIEDPVGVAAAGEIAAVDGIDALFVGPADLSVAMGLPGLVSDPQVQDAIAQVRAAAARAGVGFVSITGDPGTARDFFDTGSTMVLYNVQAALGSLFQSLASGRSETALVPGTATGTQQSTATIADPVLLLPGMLATPELWDDIGTALVTSTPGMVLRPQRIDVDDSVAGMAESVLAQAPERFSLVGHSLGGIVALEVARRAPERVRRLALLNVSGRGASDEQRQTWQELADRTRAGEFERIVGEQAQVNLGPGGRDDKLVDRWEKMARHVGAAGFLRELAAQASRPDSLPGLSALRVPTLVVSGRRDAVCPEVQQRELADGIPGARQVIVDSGHMSPLDAAPEVAAVLADFLAGADVAGVR